MALAAQNTKDSKYIHDTAKPMQNYRDALWNVEVSERNLQAEFRAEYGHTHEIRIVDLGLPNPRLKNYAQSITCSKKMLHLIDSSVDLIREKHKKGGSSTIGFSTTPIFLRSALKTPAKSCACSKIKGFSCLQELITSTGGEALGILSTVLWGYTSNECNDILNLLITRKP